MSRPQKRPPLQQSPTTTLIVNNPLSASPFAQPPPAQAPAQSNKFPAVNAATWRVPSPDNSFSNAAAAAMPSAGAPQASSGRWQGFANVFSRPSRSAQQRQQMASDGSGSLPLTGAMLPSIEEGSGAAPIGSNDLDASTAAASANQQWLRSTSSPRGSDVANDQQSGPGRYVAPSPWSTPEKSAAPSASSSQTASPFDAAARARASQSPDQRNPTLGSRSTTPQRSVSRSASGRPGYPVPSPGWTTGIQGMATTKAARPASATSSGSDSMRSRQ